MTLTVGVMVVATVPTACGVVRPVFDVPPKIGGSVAVATLPPTAPANVG
jgi:hypothetical protein